MKNRITGWLFGGLLWLAPFIVSYAQGWEYQGKIRLAGTQAYEVVDIDFTNSDTGWIIDNAGNIYQSTDGGKNWITVTLRDNHSYWSNEIAFWSSTTGISALGTNDSVIIQKTTNGGAKWKDVFVHKKDSIFGCADVAEFFVVDSQRIYAGGCVAFYSSTDGGEHWKVQKTPIDTLVAPIEGWRISCRDRNNCVLSGLLILRTTDAGDNWEIIRVAVKDGKVRTYQFNDSLMYTAGGRYFFRSTNGGKRWQITDVWLKKGEPAEIVDVHFFNPAVGYMVSKLQVYFTADSGKTFQTDSIFRQLLPDPYTGSLHVSCLPSGECWALSSEKLHLFHYKPLASQVPKESEKRRKYFRVIEAETGSGYQLEGEVRIIDIQGEQRASQIWTAGMEKLRLNTAELSSGVYWVALDNEAVQIIIRK